MAKGNMSKIQKLNKLRSELSSYLKENDIKLEKGEYNNLVRKLKDNIYKMEPQALKFGMPPIFDQYIEAPKQWETYTSDQADGPVNLNDVFGSDEQSLVYWSVDQWPWQRVPADTEIMIDNSAMPGVESYQGTVSQFLASAEPADIMSQINQGLSGLPRNSNDRYWWYRYRWDGKTLILELTSPYDSEFPTPPRFAPEYEPPEPETEIPDEDEDEAPMDAADSLLEALQAETKKIEAEASLEKAKTERIREKRELIKELKDLGFTKDEIKEQLKGL